MKAETCEIFVLKKYMKLFVLTVFDLFLFCTEFKPSQLRLTQRSFPLLFFFSTSG